MKKCICMLALSGIVLLPLRAVELRQEGNNIKFGNSVLTVRPNGAVTLVNKEMLSNLLFHVITKHPDKWFSVMHKAVKSETVSAANGSWISQSTIPASESDTVAVKTAVSLASPDSVVMEYAWTTPDIKNIMEIGLYITIPTRLLAEKEIRINGQPHKVEGETKYGWFRQTLDNPELKIFQGETGREYTLSFSGKYSVVIGTDKNNFVTVRVNAAPESREIKLTFTPGS